MSSSLALLPAISRLRRRPSLTLASFRELSQWRPTCSRTGVCHIYHNCWDAARVATGRVPKFTPKLITRGASMGLFGKTPERSPKEQVREWTSKLRKEGYQLDRQIRAIQRQEEGVKKSLKEAAKKNEQDVCHILAKEVIRARKAINRIHASKAQLNSVVMSMNHQLATLRLAGSLQRSTEVMKSMQQLIKIPEVAQTMRDLSKEMMRAGIIEEMLEDTMEGLDDQEELEEEAQEEVDKVLWELTAGTLGKAPTAVTESLPSEDVEVAGPSTSLAEDEDDDVSKMQERLQALRS